MIKHGEEFQREAVRIALTSGLPRKRLAADLGVGLSTLTRWMSLHRSSDLPASPDTDLARERTAPPGEPRAEGGEGYPKKGHAVLREPAAVRFAFVESSLVRGDDLPGSHVSTRGYRSWRSSDQPADAHGYEGAGPYPLPEPGQLWVPSHDD